MIGLLHGTVVHKRSCAVQRCVCGHDPSPVLASWSEWALGQGCKCIACWVPRCVLPCLSFAGVNWLLVPWLMPVLLPTLWLAPVEECPTCELDTLLASALHAMLNDHD